jgi:polyhydroxybutyrate depolymerase
VRAATAALIAAGVAAAACSSTKATGGVRGGNGGNGGGSGGNGADGAAVTLCSGKTGARRGKTNRMVTVGAVNRTYIVYEPQGLDANRAAPLVFVHHGFGMTGQQMFDITQYSAVADQQGFVVAFPDGEPGSTGPWNVGTGVCGSGALVQASGDDFGFLDSMIAEIESDQCVDHAHLFVTGFSMGGYFSHHAGCMRPDLAAVAPHSGATHPFTSCAPGPKPVIIFHGTADNVIAQSCDDTARQQWVQKNGCGTGVDNVTVMGGHCEWSQGCPAHGQVVYCLFDNMAHAWAGGAPNQNFSAPDYESATELSWSFFKNYAW